MNAKKAVKPAPKKAAKIESYNHLKIEKKWQKSWEENKTYKTDKAGKKPKYYVLDMFPYPSGAGLHVGHPRGYIGSDVYARFKRMQGFNVLHPMGFDSFGLPAEQYAIKTKKHPAPFTEKLIKQYHKQLEIIGFSYDWDREVATHRPEYYQWTQWIFLQIYESWYDTKLNKARPIVELVEIFEKKGNKGCHAFSPDTAVFTAAQWKSFSDLDKQHVLMSYRLAYEGVSSVNWCEELGTVLANDEIIDGPNGPISERGEYPVTKKMMRQWFMRITAYADRLIAGLDTIDWSPSIKEIQKNWIGKSFGSEISFEIRASKDSSSGPKGVLPDLSEDLFVSSQKITVFTTRADTLFGVTYVVLAPESPLIDQLKSSIKNWKEVEKYINTTKAKTDIDRTNIEKEKTGVALDGIFVINPANGEQVPVWVADYVLASYGTGAVMGVPQHDERDHAFATKYNLPIIDRPLVDAKEITIKVGGSLVTRYKMRDAIFARQRYWGEPIPLVHEKNGLIKALKDRELPLELPNVKSYQPSGNGESPLATVKSWVNAGYETNTMPGWAGSSWYFLRYMDPKNKKFFADRKETDYWQAVDTYIGGTEHATGHLLYSRFWNKVLKDLGHIKTEEPFKVLKNQGMILATDGRKMSKRWGNVINPDDVVKTYGADTLRVYEMFMGPFESSLPWSTESIIGSRRFIDRMWRLGVKVAEAKDIKKSGVLAYQKVLHKTIKKVTDDIHNFSFNTSISAMMILLNEMEKEDYIKKDDFKKFLQILAPFASHSTEELWYMFGEKKSIHLSTWPKFDPKMLIEDTYTVAIQINGKVRGEIELLNSDSEADIRAKAVLVPKVVPFLKGLEIKKIIIVPKRIINIVV